MPIQHDLEMMPNPPEFKDAFKKRYEQLLGKQDLEKFLTYSSAFPHRSIRVNTLKTNVAEIKQRLEKKWELEPVPWCKEGFWIRSKGEEQRRDVGNLKEHALGYIYVQESASMLPPLALDAQPGDVILDMCAAPGSKTTQIAEKVGRQGLVIANEYKGARLAPLAQNVQRIGTPSVICTQMDGNRIKDMQFDRILVDAPCSGIGTISKSPKTALIWNPGMIKRIARTQLNLIEKAYTLLKPGGTLVYSTCTTEPDENEGVVSSFIKRHDDMKVLPIDIDIIRRPPIQEFEGRVFDPRVKECLRIWPQDNHSEGFFVAKFMKQESSDTSDSTPQ